MKKTTCNALRGACDVIITGSTPEEMGNNSKKHVMEMVAAGDQAHLTAIEDMKKLSPEEQQKWYQEFLASFDSLPQA